MAWILDNLQIVIVIATTIAWWLNQRRESKNKADEDGPPRGPTLEEGRESPWTTVDHEELERTRKIQEDIRRKIAERQGRAVPPPVPPMSAPIPDSSARPFAPVPATRAELSWDAEEMASMERQRRLADQLKSLDEAKREAQRQSKAVWATSPDPNAIGTASRGRVERAEGEDAWLEQLQNPAEARRAVILREILGTPVALK